MKSPWYCPYCEQTSTRKWNLSTHIQRKHRGLYNPIPDMKQVTLFDSYSSQQKPESSNSFLPQYNTSDPLQMIEKLIKFKNIFVYIL